MSGPELRGQSFLLKSWNADWVFSSASPKPLWSTIPRSKTSDVEQLFQGSKSISLLGNWTFPLNICLCDEHHLHFSESRRKRCQNTSLKHFIWWLMWNSDHAERCFSQDKPVSVYFYSILALTGWKSAELILNLPFLQTGWVTFVKFM